MKRIGTDLVYMTGSRITVERLIWAQNGRFYAKWYGNMIEVAKASHCGYYSVEEY